MTLPSLSNDEIDVYEEVYGFRFSGKKFNQNDLLAGLKRLFPETKLPKETWSCATADVELHRERFEDKPASLVNRHALLMCGYDWALPLMTKAGLRHYLPAFLKVLIEGQTEDDYLRMWEGFLGGLSAHLERIIYDYKRLAPTSKLNENRLHFLREMLEVALIRMRERHASDRVASKNKGTSGVDAGGTGGLSLRGFHPHAISMYADMYGFPLSGKEFQQSLLLDDLRRLYPETKLPRRTWTPPTPDVAHLISAFGGRPASLLDRRATLECGAEFCLQMMTKSGLRHYLPAFLKVLILGRQKGENDTMWGNYLIGLGAQLMCLLNENSLHDSPTPLTSKRAQFLREMLEVVAIRREETP